MSRFWKHKEHFRHLEPALGKWHAMYDSKGNILPGIKGMKGVCGEKEDGSYIGADFILIQPGSRFPLHTHQGDHEIYFIQGQGYVHIDGRDIIVYEGSLIHIPAEYPHGVWVPASALRPLVFVAMGHPHQDVHSLNRMQLIESHSRARRTPRASHSHGTGSSHQ